MLFSNYTNRSSSIDAACTSCFDGVSHTSAERRQCTADLDSHVEYCRKDVSGGEQKGESEGKKIHEWGG